MAMTFIKASRRPLIFRRLTSFTVLEFKTLADKLRSEWKELEYKRLSSRPNRQRKVGQGRPYKGSFETMLLLTVMYLRTAIGGALLSYLFSVDEVTMRSWRNLLLPLLQDRFIPQTIVRGTKRRINDLDEFLNTYPELTEMIADGVEMKIQRPKRKQGKNYTGKSKRHVKEIIVTTNRIDNLFLGRTKLRPGSVHDKRILDEDPLHKRLSKNAQVKKRVDSAWTGENPEQGWIVNKRGRRSHPLTDIDKKQNRKLSRIRIKIEHAIRRLKIFRRIAETVVIRTQGLFDQTINAAMNLANFKELVRQPTRA